MVEGSSSARVEGYRTRRPTPAVLLALILAAAAGLVWSSVLHQTSDGCTSVPPAAEASAASEPVPADGLDEVPPAPPQFTRVHVLNANGVHGEATVIDGELAQLGFATTNTPANDPLYPSANLRCYGQIRFGAAGQAAARTLSLVAPCAQLVRDTRPDAGIDLALGLRFLAMRPNAAARTALLDLAGLGPPVPVATTRNDLAAQSEPATSIATASQTGTPLAVPEVSPSLLRQARQVTC